MQRNTLFSFLTIAALGLLTAGSANAACTFTWTGNGTGDFRDADNWTTSGDCAQDYPTTGDTVIIPDVANDPVIDDQNEVFGELQVQNAGLLTITGKKLTLNGTTAHDIDGEVRLSNAAAKLTFTDNVTIGGDSNGKIVGQDNSAQLLITGGKTLTNDITVSGKMKVMTALAIGQGNGSFVNRSMGQVLANVAGTLRFEDLDLSGAGVWKAETNGSAILEFATADTSGLSGDFTLSHNATLKFLASITTTGIFTTDPRCGLVDVDTNASVCFKATGNQFELCDNATYSTGCP